MSPDRSDALILALDLPDRNSALPLLEQMREARPWIKIGLQLFLREGRRFVEEVARMGFPIFLDLKLHDIPNTVASAIGSLAGLPVGLLTLHTSGGREMMQRAAEAAREYLPQTRLLGVTVLTSMDAPALHEIGVPETPETQVLRLGKLAVDAGIDGLVCSPLELAPLRQALGKEALLVTPGIRPAGSATGDQKRIMTPADAIRQGASYIVVGRPILKADDPATAAQAIQRELAGAL